MKGGVCNGCKELALLSRSVTGRNLCGPCRQRERALIEEIKRGDK